MTLDHLTAILTALASVIAALMAFFKALQVSGQVQDVHLSINSRMDQMLALSKNASHAEGVNEGMATGTAQAELKAAVALADQKVALMTAPLPVPVTAPPPEAIP